jgi:hypothetical protein
MSEETDRPARDVELEKRVYRLETEVAERLGSDDNEFAERVIARLSRLAAERQGDPDGPGVLVLASSADAPPPPPGAILNPPEPPRSAAPRGWFPANLLAELRLIVVMYFDPRYRISRVTQFVVPAILLLLVFNYLLFSVWLPVPFLSPVLERLLAVIAGVVIYKLLTRELARYREVLAYLARYAPR